MGLPGVPSSQINRVVAVMPLVVLAMMGCLNPFSNFYTGKRATDLRQQGVVLPAKPVEPTVMSVRDVGVSVKQYVNEGWYYMGGASWIGPGRLFWEGDARSHAREIGASLVLVSWSPAGTRSVSMPVTTPTTSTTYVGGNIYSGSGNASFSGTATTYGTQTTYQNVSIPQYEYDSAFLCKPSRGGGGSSGTQPDPMLGVVVAPIRPDDEQRTGRTTGVVIRSVTSGGPAASAGLRSGDVIVRIGDAWVGGLSTYNAAITDNLGRLMEFEFYRNRSAMSCQAKLKGTDRSTYNFAPASPPEASKASAPEGISPYRNRAPTETPADPQSPTPESP